MDPAGRSTGADPAGPPRRCATSRTLFRPGHLAQLAKILDDPRRPRTTGFVARTMLQNTVRVGRDGAPSCQDTGTAIVMGKKGQQVWTLSDGAPGGESPALACSAPTPRATSATTGRADHHRRGHHWHNLPAQIDLMAVRRRQSTTSWSWPRAGQRQQDVPVPGDQGAAQPESLMSFVAEKIRTLGTSACPPYHLAIVIGGTSAEMNLKTVKLASACYLDGLLTGARQAHRDQGPRARGRHLASGRGHRHRRPVRRQYFVHDVRVDPPAATGARVPVGIGVSCSADRKRGQDHRGGRVRRAARDRPGAVPARGHRQVPPGVEVVRRRPQPSDGTDPRRAQRYPIRARLSPQRSDGGGP